MVPRCRVTLEIRRPNPRPENEHDTSYLVYVGKQSAFPGTTTVSRNQITDDQRQTVYVFEAKASSVGWTQPNDLEEGRSSLEPGVDVGSGVQPIALEYGHGESPGRTPC